MYPEKYRYIIKLIVTVIILFFIIQLLDYEKLINALSIANKELLVFSFLTVPVWIGLKSLKWRILLSSFWPETSMWLACRSFMGGLGPGLLTPAKVGEFTRSLYLPYKDNFKVISLVILDRYCDLISLLFFSSLGISYFLGLGYGIGMIIFGVIGIALFYICPFLLKRIGKNSQNSKFFKNWFLRLADILEIKPGIFYKSLLLSSLIFIISMLTSFLLLNSFQATQISLMYKVFPLTLLTNIFPLTIGNLGIREGATIILLNEFQISSEIAFNIAIILFFLHSFLPAIIGTFIAQLGENQEQSP